IAASPFIAVGSTDPSGMVDLSPKGDSAGFVRCLDDTTLAIPDRRGNRRVDTFQNLRQNPGIGLILFVPGQRETLRVTGRAIVVRDRNIRNAMADHGQMPDLAMIVKLRQMHHALQALEFTFVMAKPGRVRSCVPRKAHPSCLSSPHPSHSQKSTSTPSGPHSN